MGDYGDAPSAALPSFPSPAPVASSSNAVTLFFDKDRSVEADPLIKAFPALYGQINDRRLMAVCACLQVVASMMLHKRPIFAVYVDTPAPHLNIIWNIKHIKPKILSPTEVDGAVLALTRNVSNKLLPQSCLLEMDWLDFTKSQLPSIEAMDAAVKGLALDQALMGALVVHNETSHTALLRIAPMYPVQTLLCLPYNTLEQECPILQK